MQSPPDTLDYDPKIPDWWLLVLVAVVVFIVWGPLGS